MLRDKYTFKMGQRSVESLADSLQDSFEEHRETRNSVCALCLLSLQPFYLRLKKAALTPGKHSFHIKRVEAVALHLAYVKGFVNHRDFLVQSIFSTIDRTL